MAISTKKVNQLSSGGTLAAGDKVVGEKVSGQTTLLTVGQLQPSDGDKGDITVTSSGTVWTVDNDAITYAKIQNVSATDKLLGRSTAGAGDIEEIALTAAGRALIDDVDATAQRTTLGLGTLATQSGTFSGTSSGTNTGDQNTFLTLSVSGQSDIVADATADTLTIAAGTGITLTTNASTDTLTITGSVGGGGLDAYTTTATAASTTTLTVSSNYQQFFTGSTTQTVVMPVTSTLVLGQSWLIVNNSTGAVTINSSGSNLIQTLLPNTAVIITCILTSGTTAASWDSKVQINPSSTLGSQNTIAGTGAGAAITSGGNDNVLIGFNAGNLITTSDNNVAIGSTALGAVTTTGTNAVAVGFSALGGLTSGTQCVGVGYQAGNGMTTSGSMTAVGYQAAPAITGASNVAIGDTTMANGTASRASNVIIGSAAGNFGTGSTSVVIGAGTAGRQHGSNCVYVGGSAGANATGASNTAVGDNAMSDGTGGASTKNTAIGALTMNAGATGAVVLTSASGNTIVGYRAGVSAADCADAIAIGQDAVATKATGSTSGTFGPGLSIGSAAKPVGFRGDGTIIPSTAGGAGFLKAKLNGTQYYVPLFADASSTIIGTGSGSIVGATSPTLVTPVLGAASATSINFGQSTLDYYEEGTFTPTFSTATVGDLSVVYTNQTGSYRRIGKIVYLTYRVDCTPTFTTASGVLKFGGLPFAAGANTGGGAFYDITASISWGTLKTQLQTAMDGGTSVINLQGFANGTTETQVTTAEIVSGVAIRVIFNMTYSV